MATKQKSLNKTKSLLNFFNLDIPVLNATINNPINTITTIEPKQIEIIKPDLILSTPKSFTREPILTKTTTNYSLTTITSIINSKTTLNLSIQPLKQLPIHFPEQLLSTFATTKTTKIPSTTKKFVTPIIYPIQLLTTISTTDALTINNMETKQQQITTINNNKIETTTITSSIKLLNTPETNDIIPKLSSKNKIFDKNFKNDSFPEIPPKSSIVSFIFKKTFLKISMACERRSELPIWAIVCDLAKTIN